MKSGRRGRNVTRFDRARIWTVQGKIQPRTDESPRTVWNIKQSLEVYLVCQYLVCDACRQRCQQQTPTPSTHDRDYADDEPDMVRQR